MSALSWQIFAVFQKGNITLKLEDLKNLRIENA